MIYAVNKRTKEHRIHTPGYPSSLDEEFVEATPGGWIEWQGGVCPLPDECGVEAKTNIGIRSAGRADEFRWARQSRPGDIIAYRPILDDDTKPAPPAWDGEGLPPVGCECEFEHAEEGNWINAKVIGYDGPACVVAIDGDGYSGSSVPGDFRPTRSEEDRAVDEMVAAMENAIESSGGGYVVAVSSQLEMGARALYRAGYRNTGGE